MLELVILFLLIAGAKKAWDDMRTAWSRSRRAYTGSAARRYPDMSPARRTRHALRHDLGYGLSQLAHGFPQARHGFAQGWHEGRQAHVQARTERERARTEHAEARLSGLSAMQDLRRRRREALEEIRRQGQGEGTGGSEATCPDDPAVRNFCAYCGTRDDQPCPPRCATWTLSGNPYPGRENDPAYSYGPESAASGWPSATAEHAHDAARRASEDGKPWVVTEYPPGGGPGRTVAVYRNGEPAPGPEQETEEEDISKMPARDGRPEVARRTPVLCADHPDRDCELVEYADGTREHVALAEGDPGGIIRKHRAMWRNRDNQPETEGNTMPDTTAGDTTYTQQLGELTAIRQDAEEEVNSVRRKRMMNRLDILTGLGLDSASLSEAAAIDDALQAQEKAAQQTLDASDAAIHGLKQRHGGIQEAVDNAPVDKPAQPEFYAN